MKKIFEKWWDKGNKVIQLISYRDSWKSLISGFMKMVVEERMMTDILI